MSSRRLWMIVFGLFAAACQQKPAVSTDEIVARHIAAIGGEAALRSVTGWHVAAVVHDLPTPGKIQTWVEAPEKVRIDSNIGGVEESIAYNGREGWARNRSGIEKLTGKRTKSIRRKAYLDEILAYHAGRGAITREADERVDGRKCHVLVLGASRNNSVTAYVDATSFLIVKTVTPILSPEGTLMRLEMRYSDYRRVGGVLMPFALHVKGDYGNYRITTQSVEMNVNADDSLFEAPAT